MVDVLEKEGRTCDIREESAEYKALYQALAKEITILHQCAERPEPVRETAHAVRLLQRFLVRHRRHDLDDTDSRQHKENAVPGREEKNLPAKNRRRDRSKTIYHHEDRHEAHKLRPFAHVPCNGTGDDDAERP